MYENQIFLVHQGQTSEPVEFADPAIAKFGLVFCTPPISHWGAHFPHWHRVCVDALRCRRVAPSKYAKSNITVRLETAPAVGHSLSVLDDGPALPTGHDPTEVHW